MPLFDEREEAYIYVNEYSRKIYNINEWLMMSLSSIVLGIKTFSAQQARCF